MTDIETESIARGVLESIGNQLMVLTIPQTEYKIHLAPTVPLDQLAAAVGKRIKGTIEAKALRIFKANGGGRFIEPIWGQPRIIAGLVLTVDPPNRRLLVETIVPMWLVLEGNQSTDMFSTGDLVNCYVESGATFTPLDA